MFRAAPGHQLAHLDQIGAIVVISGPTSTDFGPTRPELSTSLAQLRPSSPRVGGAQAPESIDAFCQLGPKLVDIRSAFGHLRRPYHRCLPAGAQTPLELRPPGETLERRPSNFPAADIARFAPHIWRSKLRLPFPWVGGYSVPTETGATRDTGRICKQRASLGRDRPLIDSGRNLAGHCSDLTHARVARERHTSNVGNDDQSGAMRGKRAQH